MIPIFQKHLEIQGFNACIMPHEEGYVGLSRVCEYHDQRGIYPEATNSINFFILNKDFEIIFIKELEDKTGRTIHKNWTQGIEDPRMLSLNEFTAVTCDTNDRWKAEMSYIHIDINLYQITKIMPLYMNGTQHLPQKNWIFLNKVTDELSDYLYGSFPFTVIRVSNKTGHSYILKEENVPGYDIVTHNAAAIKIKDEYLITLRVKEGHDYHHSFWIKLNENYDFIKVSKPFRFLKDSHTNEDGTFNAAGYEMCMSLHLENKNEVVVCVSVEDRDVYIQKYDLDDIENMFY